MFSKAQRFIERKIDSLPGPSSYTLTIPFLRKRIPIGIRGRPSEKITVDNRPFPETPPPKVYPPVKGGSVRVPINNGNGKTGRRRASLISLIGTEQSPGATQANTPTSIGKNGDPVNTNASNEASNQTPTASSANSGTSTETTATRDVGTMVSDVKDGKVAKKRTVVPFVPQHNDDHGIEEDCLIVHKDCHSLYEENKKLQSDYNTLSKHLMELGYSNVEEVDEEAFLDPQHFMELYSTDGLKGRKKLSRLLECKMTLQNANNEISSSLKKLEKQATFCPARNPCVICKLINRYKA